MIQRTWRAMAGNGWAPAAVLLAGAAAASAGPMDREQLYTPPEEKYEIHERLEPLLAKALERPREITRLKALAEVGRVGFTGQAERVIELVDADSTVVATTAVRTLERLDAKSAADRLLRLLREGEAPAAQVRLADRMLGRWGDQRAVELWRARLGKAEASASLQRSAAVALGRTPGAEPGTSAELMRTVVLDRARPNGLRLAAAEALARIAGETDTSLALDTAAEMGDSSFEALLAVRMLQTAEGERGITLLKERARGSEPAMQAEAMRRLRELGPELLWPRVEQTLGSPDPRVRLVSVRSLKTRRQTGTIGWLTESINDPHPEVRTKAREMLKTLSEHKPLLKPVKEAMRGVIETAIEEKERDEPPHWRAGEQAALLLGRLDDEPTADRLVELFVHSRPEVRVAAVKALRRMDVESTYEPMHQLMKDLVRELPKLRQQIMELKDPAKQRAASDRFQAQSRLAAETAQTLGVWKVTAADAVLRKLIPKSFAASPRARASAVWALGLLHRNAPDQGLASTLVGRMQDLSPLNPERIIVRQKSAETLGRMKAQSQVEALRGAMNTRRQGMSVRAAARWAIERITGESVPELASPVSREMGYFVSPYEGG